MYSEVLIALQRLLSLCGLSKCGTNSEIMFILSRFCAGVFVTEECDAHHGWSSQEDTSESSILKNFNNNTVTDIIRQDFRPTELKIKYYKKIKSNI